MSQVGHEICRAFRYLDPIQSGQNVILLLDKPGLTLHASGQSDLLRYIREQLPE